MVFLIWTIKIYHKKTQPRRGCDILHPYRNRTGYSDLFCGIATGIGFVTLT